MRIAITGFGRIGRLLARIYFKEAYLQEDLDLVAINDLSPSDVTRYLLKYDSTHGPRHDLNIEAAEKSLTINGKKITKLAERDPNNINWADLGVDIVLECTGYFKKRDQAAIHLNNGAKKVLISAPSSDADAMIVYGVNHKIYKADTHHVISNASCTTNCLAPVANVIHQNFGIEQGLITTIHSYTGDQRLLDNSHKKDPRRGRAAALNMVPTTTGAAKAVGHVIPDLEGKLDGLAVRVPTANVSLTDLVATLKTQVSAEDVNQALRKAADNELKGVMQVSDEPLVSSDFNGSSYSSIVDAPLTRVLGDKGNMLKIYSWYDNEMGFSYRMLDLAKYMAKQQ